VKKISDRAASQLGRERNIRPGRWPARPASKCHDRFFHGILVKNLSRRGSCCEKTCHDGGAIVDKPVTTAGIVKRPVTTDRAVKKRIRPNTSPGEGRGKTIRPGRPGREKLSDRAAGQPGRGNISDRAQCPRSVHTKNPAGLTNPPQVEPLFLSG
jgi:hypothetical protein